MKVSKQHLRWALILATELQGLLQGEHAVADPLDKRPGLAIHGLGQHMARRTAPVATRIQIA